MALTAYRKKRNFDVTSEPDGETKAEAGNSFVIQKHAARRLHYDLRLEMDGVLKSWAVTRGPSLVPGERRLAVHVEDHPLDYGDFEGTIPQGEYGGGSVLLWDRGTWEPVGDQAKGYAKGHMEFALTGEKLHGRWHLVRMQPKPGEKSEGWLLIKSEDEYSRPAGAPDILEERPESVKTGRLIGEIGDKAAPKRKPQAEAAGAKPKAAKQRTGGEVPEFIPPMLANLVPATPQGARWLHEIKFDGYRLQARIAGGKARLLTRSGIDWTERFGPAIVKALKGLGVDAVLDGELVVETASGLSDFSALQADLSAARSDRFIYHAFDLMFLDGVDLRALPLVERKASLQRALEGVEGPVRYGDHFAESGQMVLKHACRLGLEGIVSKLKDGPYRTGRSKSWVKSKCSARQEFVIGGFAKSTVSDTAIGSLVLGVHEGGKLQHVGRVGTGFTNAVAQDLHKRLTGLAVKQSPFSERLKGVAARGVQYVRPELVAEVEFRAWTGDGQLRHASFRGLREDKAAKDVQRETTPAAKKEPVPKRTVTLTHPDRVYWPGEGVTKEGLADYYAEVWRHIAPHILGRPLALLRCPTGINGQAFFQKNIWKGLNRHIALLRDPSDGDGPPLIGVNDIDGLMGLVQAAALELHPWGSTVADWERPDRIVMDLDPGDGVAWEDVILAAEDVRARLEAVGLAAFVKTSGGKGLHVVAPLKPKAEWPVVKTWCKAFADKMAKEAPEKYVATVTKSKRQGKILIDYLRNQRGATAVAPYSTRARPGAAVSTPVEWTELGPGLGPDHFTVTTLPARLVSLARDPWAEFFEAAVPLPKAP